MTGRVRLELTTTDSQNQRNTFAVRILKITYTVTHVFNSLTANKQAFRGFMRLLAVPQRIELWSSDRQSDIIHHYTMRPRVAFDNPAADWVPTLCDEC